MPFYRLIRILFFMYLATPNIAIAQICNASGNVVIFSNYEGGVLNIDVNQNIPNLKIGICTYEVTQVTISGAFVGNVTEVIYAGSSFGSSSGCGPFIASTTITGVPSGIVKTYSYANNNVAITNYFGDDVISGIPLVNCMVGADGACSNNASGGGNASPQIVQFFLAEFGTGSVLRSHTTDYNCFSGTYSLSTTGNCCLETPITAANPIYRGGSNYSFMPSDSSLCSGSINLDLSNYPVLLQPPTYFGYLWNNGVSNAQITITNPGTYIVNVADYCHGNWSYVLADTMLVSDCGQITTGAVSSLSFCQGASGTVAFTSVGNFLPGNSYVAELSDAAGLFGSPTNVGILMLGATTGGLVTITIPAGTPAGTGYRVRIRSSTPSIIGTTSSLNITILAAPQITVQPVNQTVCPNNNALFTVGASGAGVSYLWQVKSGGGVFVNCTGAPYSGESTASLLISPATSNMNNYQYQCVVSGTCSPTVTSNAANLSINPSLSILNQPVGASICANTNTQFMVNASGSSLSYEWQVQTGTGAFQTITTGGVYSGTSTATLSLTNVPLSYNYLYKCIITDGICNTQVTTVTILLTVTDCSTSVTTIGATGNPFCAGDNSQISFNTTGTYNVGNVFTVQLSDAAGSFTAPQVIGSGATSPIAVTIPSSASSSSGYRIRVISSSPANICTVNGIAVTVNGLIVPTVQIDIPPNTSICKGASITLNTTTTFTGTNPVFQWKINGLTVGTNSASFLTSNLVQNDVVIVTLTAGAQTCMTNNTANSNSIQFTVSDPKSVSINIAPKDSAVCEGVFPEYYVNSKNNVGNAPIFTWYLNGKKSGTNASNFRPITLRNNDSVRCAVTSNAGCILGSSTISSNQIKQTVNPYPALTLVPTIDSICSTQIRLGEKLTVKASGAESYLWEPNVGISSINTASTELSPISSQQYSLVGISKGCKTRISFCVDVISDENADLPSAFSPNEDKENDELLVRGKGIRTMRLRIFDRWGEMVFESLEMKQGWDGTFRGKALDPAVFTYYLNVEFMSGNSVVKQGNVSLVR